MYMDDMDEKIKSVIIPHLRKTIGLWLEMSNAPSEMLQAIIDKIESQNYEESSSPLLIAEEAMLIADRMVKEWKAQQGMSPFVDPDEALEVLRLAHFGL